MRAFLRAPVFLCKVPRATALSTLFVASEMSFSKPLMSLSEHESAAMSACAFMKTFFMRVVISDLRALLYKRSLADYTYKAITYSQYHAPIRRHASPYTLEHHVDVPPRARFFDRVSLRLERASPPSSPRTRAHTSHHTRFQTHLLCARLLVLLRFNDERPLTTSRRRRDTYEPAREGLGKIPHHASVSHAFSHHALADARLAPKHARGDANYFSPPFPRARPRRQARHLARHLAPFAMRAQALRRLARARASLQRARIAPTRDAARRTRRIACVPLRNPDVVGATAWVKDRAKDIGATSGCGDRTARHRAT